mmetsp:Transcript_21171/g.20322  ORF Transcript_21171/g.20322 Transcript_21171/m.20322 type:complete len:96 (-) Transcript_21171:811-1098(-)|eukprot:CAMPEP_0170557096 /NCGR_PEP_ID=MMETSP0211-20121228/19187_1 /TAXON_ID=311385 /ORGANISM="Pseudokeronopsis sp., Strain OXSARD2" /LENGTH=95 /DNA_ID=CAMNT_0010867811 /DNA_START=854 /DNA_END=1141 /DNA_ORIENTATION=-
MRWTVISQAVDCRTAEERDPNNAKFVPKSRYSTMNHYISNHQYAKKEFFDIPQHKVDPEHMSLLMNEGNLDSRLAHHVASLFVRDPIPAYSKEVE